jgi:hypothetical protein
MILALDLAGSGLLYSGYSSVIFLRKRWIRVSAMPIASPLAASIASSRNAVLLIDLYLF